MVDLTQVILDTWPLPLFSWKLGVVQGLGYVISN